MEKLNYSGYGKVSIEDVVRGVGVTSVHVIRPYNIKKSIASVKEALSVKGVSVIISREACTLYARGLKAPMKRPFKVGDKCKNHRTCINEFACPAFSVNDNRVSIDPDLCTGCSVCAQICPERAIIPVKAG
jgi:indolepyruvate ferredoxin oxidoreductase alpha subunit